MPSWYGFKTQDPLFDPNLGQPSRGGRGNIGVPPQPTPRQMQQQAYQTGAAPRGGGRGWQEGGVVDYASNFAAPWHRDADPSEALMAERESLQQLLQMETDNERAMILLSRIEEITKELEMDARNFGMANGGIASLMGI